MPSLSSLIVAFLLNMIQFVLSVDAKGGGGKGTSTSKGKGTKGSGGTYSTPVYRGSNGYCYDSDSHENQISCPSKLGTGDIVGIAFGCFVLVAAICVYIWCDYVNKRTQNENSEEVYTKILSDTKNDRLEMGKPVEYVYGS